MTTRAEIAAEQALRDCTNVVAYMLGWAGHVIGAAFDQYEIPQQDRDRILSNAGEALRVTAIKEPPHDHPR
jgi:hypothetical protein